MKKIIHFYNAVIVACGRLRNSSTKTTNYKKKVTCKSCKKTKVWKEKYNK
jgi:hypothetical protein